jgi:hypothetical protein
MQKKKVKDWSQQNDFHNAISSGKACLAATNGSNRIADS